VLMDYARLSGRAVIAHTNVGLARLLGSLEADWNQRDNLLSDMERFLSTNGVALRKDETGAARVMSLELAKQWDGAGVAWRVEETTPPPVSIVPLRPDLSPDVHMTVALDSPTVAQALAIYSEL